MPRYATPPKILGAQNVRELANWVFGKEKVDLVAVVDLGSMKEAVLQWENLAGQVSLASCSVLGEALFGFLLRLQCNHKKSRVNSLADETVPFLLVSTEKASSLGGRAG